MKKIISFEKKLEFPSMVGEITSISLDHTLEFKSPTTIEGAFLITGTYKLTEASCIEDAFNFKIPTEIFLTENIDITTGKIEVDDFYYEIENEENLICYIDVLVEGLEEVLIEEPPLEEVEREIEEIRECDGDVNKEIEIPHQEEREEDMIEELTKEKTQIEESKVEETQVEEEVSLFSNLKDDEDTFTTYSIYILRQEETLSTVLEKYKVTKEELEEYNDLSNITEGSKIIIPVNDK